MIIKIIILNKKSRDTIHAIVLRKYKKYPSTTILKHANVLAKVNKSPYVRLLNTTPQKAYSITIHVHTMTIPNISNEQNK